MCEQEETEWDEVGTSSTLEFLGRHELSCAEDHARTPSTHLVTSAKVASRSRVGVTSSVGRGAMARSRSS